MAHHRYSQFKATLLFIFQTLQSLKQASDDYYYAQNIDFLNNLYSNYYYYDQYYTDATQNSKVNSVSDYTFNSASPKDWDQTSLTHSCSFLLKSIQKRICLSKTNNHKITLKSSAKAIDLDWDNNAYWNTITDSLADLSDIPATVHNAINTKTMNDILKFKSNSALAAHAALLNHYSMPDFSSEPFTSEMAETLTQANDEMYGFPNAQSNVAQQSMQQMKSGTYGMPGMGGMSNWGQNPMGLHGMGQYGHGMSSYGHNGHVRPTIPGQQMLTQQLLHNPQIQRHIRSNPEIMKYLTSPTGHGSNNKLLEALLKQDISDKGHPQSVHSSGDDSGLLAMIMGDQTKKNMADMFNTENENNKRFMQHSKSDFQNLANGIKRADSKLDELRVNSGHKTGNGIDMAALIHALNKGL